MFLELVFLLKLVRVSLRFAVLARLGGLGGWRGGRMSSAKSTPDMDEKHVNNHIW